MFVCLFFLCVFTRIYTRVDDYDVLLDGDDALRWQVDLLRQLRQSHLVDHHDAGAEVGGARTRGGRGVEVGQAGVRTRRAQQKRGRRQKKRRARRQKRGGRN